MRNQHRLEQDYPYLYGNRRHHISIRMLLWIISGAWVGLAAGMLIVHLTVSLFHKNVSDATSLLIHAGSVCVMIIVCTVIGWLFRDNAKTTKKEADMRYETAPKRKCLLKETLTLLVLNGGAAALMWFLLLAEDRASG